MSDRKIEARAQQVPDITSACGAPIGRIGMSGDPAPSGSTKGPSIF